MQKLQAIRKAVVCLVGVSILLVNNIWGFDLTDMEPEITKAIEDIINVAAGVMTVFGVYQVPNTKKEIE